MVGSTYKGVELRGRNKDGQIKKETKKLFGRDHSQGLSFKFDSIVKSSITCYWKVNEELFNEKILRTLMQCK